MSAYFTGELLREQGYPIIMACREHSSSCSNPRADDTHSVLSSHQQPIGTITHIHGGSYARIFRWTPDDAQGGNIPECAIRVVNKTQLSAQTVIERSRKAQDKLKSSVFALPVYYRHHEVTVMPLLKKGDLRTISAPGLDFYEFSDFLRNLLQALKELKDLDLIHGDLSASNCGWDPTACRQFAHYDYDFTDSPTDLQENFSQLVTPWYRPPEAWVMKLSQYNYSMDMWSAGCLAYRALTGKPLFPCGNAGDAFLTFERYLTNQHKVLSQNINQILNSKKDLSPRIADRKAAQLSDLLGQMLDMEPAQRISPEAALQHPFFQAPAEFDEFADNLPPAIKTLIEEYSGET